MIKQFYPYGKQFIDDEDILSVVEVLKAPFLTQGPKVQEFEKNISEFCGAQYAVAVSSATAALHLACLAADLTSADELVCPAITFVASANCGRYCGAKIQFADIDAKSFNLTANSLKSTLNSKTRVVVPVHMAGESCDMKAIQKTVSEHSQKLGKKIYIIEDASHAVGATYDGKPVGNCEFSDMAVFSFHPVKSMTTGEGGVILTNNKSLYEKLVALRTHGITKDAQKFSNRSEGPWYYEQQSLGFNYRITDIQCALGISQLKKVPVFNEKRRNIARAYNEALSNNSSIVLPVLSQNSSYHLYILRIDFESLGKSREKVMSELSELGVGSQVHYIPVYRQPYYQELYGDLKPHFPQAEKHYSQCLSIPIYPELKPEDIKYIAESILSVLDKK